MNHDMRRILILLLLLTVGLALPGCLSTRMRDYYDRGGAPSRNSWLNATGGSYNGMLQQ